jgi:hypothetical protein
MSGRLFVTLAIIAGVGLGTGALVFGVTMMTFHGYNVEEEATIASTGAALLAASAAALVARLAGAFKQLDDRDDREY